MEIKRNNATWNWICVGLLLIVFSLGVSSCHKRLGPTAIRVDDSVRHYPSIVLGEPLDLAYEIHNIGTETLVIIDVQPSCPTIEVSEHNVNTIPPGKSATFHFTYHSEKNIGLAKFSIRIFGNIAPKGVAELIFDTHVVRPSIDMSDYEEYYIKEIQEVEQKLVDENYREKDYYTTSDSN